ncbi:MAG: hypothetical protein WAK93_06170, partial [Solirubrobacteraceae bacterium]
MSPVDRRRFISRSLTAIGAGGVGAVAGAAAADETRASTPRPSLAAQSAAVDRRELSLSIPFDGHHQSGILTPRQPSGGLHRPGQHRTRRQHDV